ncbi:MAG: RNA methyltransferase [Treponema sp.]|nr:RNA methyltransferase [Treponema sp.]
MNLRNIVIVLSHPEESRNIGAVCRAMANSGLRTLRIVGARDSCDDMRVRVLAIHADVIWDSCEFFESITEATEDCVCVAGTTRRRGKKRKGKLLLPEEFADFASTITGGTAANGICPVQNSMAKSDNGRVDASQTEAAFDTPGGRVAVVFGNERTGLTDPELLECTMGVTIPSSAEFASLNLSHAVQIIGYHLFRATQKQFLGYTPIPLGRLDGTVTVIVDNLQRIGFFSRTGKDQMMQFWRTILSRAALSEGEAQYLEMIFDKAAGLATHR